MRVLSEYVTEHSKIITVEIGKDEEIEVKELEPNVFKVFEVLESI